MELLHFTANWCNPCKQMEPIISKFIEENPNITYTKIDVDSNINIAQQNNVMSIPTIIALIDNVEVKRHTGIAKLSDLNLLFN